MGRGPDDLGALGRRPGSCDLQSARLPDRQRTWGNLYAALAYLTPGYQAYKDLQDTYNGVVWNTAYANIDTSRTTAGDAVIWADNCYSVDVTYDAKCTLNGKAIDYEAATLRIYFLKTNAGYIISNFETL